MKKYLLPSLLFLLAFTPAFAQENEPDPIPYQLVEQKPTFNGGVAEEFSKWVNSQLVYPEESKKSGSQGRVTVRFIIEPDGSVTNVKVPQGVDTPIDDDVIRIVSSSPKWEPGRQNGSEVRVEYAFPIIYLLQGNKYVPDAGAPSITASPEYPHVGEKDAVNIMATDRRPKFYDGGFMAFTEWVNSKLVYPESEKANGTEARVRVKFVIQADGCLTDAAVLFGVSPEFDAEAVRVVSESPKWIPASLDDKPVATLCTYVVIFRPN